jgi:hypothetical protein
MTKPQRQKFLLAKQVAQTGAPAAQARLDRPQVGARHLSDFFIRQSLQIAENNDQALIDRQLRQPCLDGARQFAAQRKIRPASPTCRRSGAMSARHQPVSPDASSETTGRRWRARSAS